MSEVRSLLRLAAFAFAVCALPACGGGGEVEPSETPSPEVPRSELPAHLQPESGERLAAVLVRTPVMPNAEGVTAVSGSLGLALTLESEDRAKQIYSGEDGLVLAVSLSRGTYPDAARMAVGWTSPESAKLSAATAFYTLTLSAPEAPRIERDVQLAKLTAAVVRASQTVGAFLDFNKVLHGVEVFAGIRAESSPELLPVDACIDLTIDADFDGRASILTHNMTRFGREDVFASVHPERIEAGLQLLRALVEAHLRDPELYYETGSSFGRTPEESVRVLRGASPADPNQTVMILELY